MPHKFRGKNMKTDVLIIGAGPAGIFTALEMLRYGSKKSITIIDNFPKFP
jgi:2-polyprenyl-6-methoxyphenol hydroxylase-like FAD-dependent oxidoreductase